MQAQALNLAVGMSVAGEPHGGDRAHGTSAKWT